jgi:probable O-glycosylation ligase (exosortase A-associated)
LIGLKGALFSIISGGAHRVYGPEGTFINDNNDLGLALNMTLPLMFYLWKDEENFWVKTGLKVFFVATIVAIIFTYSRGAFLALGVVGFMLMVKARYKSLAIIILGIGIIVGTLVVPAQWSERMGTIKTYEQDQSAQGRLNAWATAWKLALDRPLIGGGFQVFFVRDVFRKYAPDPTDVRDVHSSYFEMLGEQGFIGLAIYIALIATTLSSLTGLKWRLKRSPEIQWPQHYPDMLQVSLIAYLIGGAFLGRAYFDLFYQMVAAAVVLKQLVNQEVSTKATVSASTLIRGTLRPAVPRMGLRT